MIRKGEHKHVFAYAVETACDKHGWILGYTVHPGNEHDSRTFKTLYDKLKKLAKILEKRGWNTAGFLAFLKKIKKELIISEKWCWA